MTQPLTLSTQTDHPAMDFDGLRRRGIGVIERLGGAAWTDFNTHDPGITILEQACYAITDLSYRINYDIKDILASGGESGNHRSLFSPARVLTTNPVTLADYRKLLLDIPGVGNAWLEHVEPSQSAIIYDASENRIDLIPPDEQNGQKDSLALKGLYRVLIEADGSRPGPAILAEANERLHARRSLAVDFHAPVILPVQEVVVEADIEISSTDRPEQLMADLYETLYRSISPGIPFRTLTRMLALGKTMDGIMNGPHLTRGFIVDEDLENLERKSGLRTSDMIQDIMNLDGVVSVNHITLSGEPWYLKLDSERSPLLSMDKTRLRLVHSGIGVDTDPGRVKTILQKRRENNETQIPRDGRRDLPLPEGRDRRIGRYSSIRNQFPDNYGIGATGLPNSAPARRKAMAGQLTAYLTFFDQMLANEFAQLAHVRDLFSFDEDNPETYFSQDSDSGGFAVDTIFTSPKDERQTRIQDITTDTADRESPSGVPERKNRFLNHLLARFSEQFSTHTNDAGLHKDKCGFLKEFEHIGAARGSGCDYTRTIPDDGPPNPSGLEMRISRKLGIPTAGKAPGKGFYMVEHLLLRPGLADKNQGERSGAFLAVPSASDPYSNRVSFVFPEACNIYDEKIAKTLREETPAHILIHRLYLKKNPLADFASAYQVWTKNIRGGVDIAPEDHSAPVDGIALRDARDRLVHMLGMGLPYPLRDLSLSYKGMVSYSLSAPVTIIGGQADVLYCLCDEDGIPVGGEGTSFRLDENPHKTGIILHTPGIIRDITFTVQAIREDKKQTIRLETYLNQSVSIKVGIDTGLAVAFEPSPGQVVSETEDHLTVDYEAFVTLSVDKTQAGISYKLVTDSEEAPDILSDPVEGNEGTVRLVSTRSFKEDTPIRVQAYRTGLEGVTEFLDARLTVCVRPNAGAGLGVTIDPPVTDYDTTAVLTIGIPQDSVAYTLFGRKLSKEDYLDGNTGGITVANGQGRDIHIRTPEIVTDWDDLKDFTPFGPLNQTKSGISAETGPLKEDMLFIAKAEKTFNGQHLQLSEAAVILVRPDPGVSMDAVSETIDDVLTNTVVLTNTQKGVFYQLRLDDDGTAVGTPGYHQTDRGVSMARVSIDFEVDGQGTADLLLPVGDIKKTTVFNVLAEKIFSGVRVQLSGKAAIEVASTIDLKSPPPDSETGAPEEEE